MSQWTSAFAEAVLGVSKTAGDLAGPCAFALFKYALMALAGELGLLVRPNSGRSDGQCGRRTAESGAAAAMFFPALMLLGISLISGDR